DTTLFGEVLRNLLNNALKFCRPGDRITFFVPPDDPAAIAVKDTGVGVDPAILPDLFRHEVRTSRRGTQGEAGTGLGLPYSADIMKAHGGDLTVASTPGAGTTFVARLPMVQPVALVVDDELALRMTVRHYLGGIGVRVVEAENGDRALALLALSPPHLIIADVMMPVMDGFTLLERLKADPVGRDIPVIVLTGRNADTRNQAFARGADDFLAKPVQADDLLSRVRKYLG
ncbi:MAG: response regulator, partial [Nitrospinae bacterium]|nr:response regulator [Nitrospinota bacterium]